MRTSPFGPETPEFNPMRVLRNRVVAEFPQVIADITGQATELIKRYAGA
ncbi:hypothetical protein [Actinoplanes sp. SE50/110]|nr:hypothetical protein [Actinoplanes sp. SE50/110]